jgi:hypothetical protein
MGISRDNPMYEVLGPWADADPVPLRGLTAARIETLDGKRIGLFQGIKRASGPILTVVEKKLKERYPKAEFSWYRAQSLSVSEQEPQNRGKFEEWIRGVDAVILAVAD